MVTNYDRISQSHHNWVQDVPTLHETDGNVITVNNFRTGYDESDDFKVHLDRVTIDASKIKDVYVGIEPFQPEIIAAHGLLIFTMYTDDSVTSSTGYRDYGFALSVESRREVGEGFTITEGFGRKYGMAYRLGGIADQLQRVTRLEGHELWMHRLKLTRDQKMALVKDTLLQSTEDMTGRWYHSMTDSCYTACVDLLNDVLEPEQKMARWTNFLKLARVLTSLPSAGSTALYGKRLLHDEKIKVITPDGPDTKQVTWMNELLRRVAESWYAKLTCKFTTCLLGIMVLAKIDMGTGQYLLSVNAFVAIAHNIIDRGFDMMWVKNNIEPVTASQWYGDSFSCDYDIARDIISRA
jgi:hypothetical protein